MVSAHRRIRRPQPIAIGIAGASNSRSVVHEPRRGIAGVACLSDIVSRRGVATLIPRVTARSRRSRGKLFSLLRELPQTYTNYIPAAGLARNYALNLARFDSSTA